MEFKTIWRVPANTQMEAVDIVKKVIDELKPIMKKYNIKQVERQISN